MGNSIVSVPDLCLFIYYDLNDKLDPVLLSVTVKTASKKYQPVQKVMAILANMQISWDMINLMLL